MCRSVRLARVTAMAMVARYQCLNMMLAMAHIGSFSSKAQVARPIVVGALASVVAATLG